MIRENLIESFSNYIQLEDIDAQLINKPIFRRKKKSTMTWVRELTGDIVLPETLVDSVVQRAEFFHGRAHHEVDIIFRENLAEGVYEELMHGRHHMIIRNYNELGLVDEIKTLDNVFIKSINWGIQDYDDFTIEMTLVCVDVN